MISEELRKIVKEWREAPAPLTENVTESWLRMMMAACANQLEPWISDIEELEELVQSSAPKARER